MTAGDLKKEIERLSVEYLKQTKQWNECCIGANVEIKPILEIKMKPYIFKCGLSETG